MISGRLNRDVITAKKVENKLHYTLEKECINHGGLRQRRDFSGFIQDWTEVNSLTLAAIRKTHSGLEVGIPYQVPGS